MTVSERRLCQEPDCQNVALACFLPGHEKPHEYLCSDHAPQAGYCAVCGDFWAGVESFDFGPGVCENCRGNEGIDDDPCECGECELCWNDYPEDAP